MKKIQDLNRDLPFQANMPYEESGLYRAISSVGGMSELGRLLTKYIGKNVSRQAIHQWRKYGRIPQPYIMPIHKITNLSYEDLLSEFEPYQSKD